MLSEGTQVILSRVLPCAAADRCPHWNEVLEKRTFDGMEEAVMAGDADLRKLYERIISAIGADDAGALDGLMSAGLVDHNPVPDQPPGREGFVFWMHSAHTSFPDMTGTIQDTVVEGNRIAGRVVWTGTHEGEFLGLPGSGRQLSMAAMHLVRFEDGVAVEWWGASDLLGAAMGLGARLEPGRAVPEERAPEPGWKSPCDRQ